MNLYLILKSTLTAIADAIREKLGSTDDMTPLEMPALIQSIQTGGGMSWELIVDETSDEQTTVFNVNIPEGEQEHEMYKVHFQSNTSVYYPKFGINSSYAGYTNNARLNFDTHVVKIPYARVAELNGTAPASYYAMPVPSAQQVNCSQRSAPLITVGIQQWTSAYPLPAGINIKVWRIIES